MKTTLFLPYDTIRKKRYKYTLTVVNIASRYKDAEPISDTTATTVATALTKIYSLGPLKYPRFVQVDDGSEFKGAVNQLFAKHCVLVRRSIPGVDRSQAIVENFKQLSKRLFSYQYAKELMHDTLNTEWVKRLPSVIKAMNNEGHVKPAAAIKLKTITDPKTTTPSGPPLAPDTNLFTKQVRYLYQPRESENDVTRMSTDPIWSTTIHNIKKKIPGSPSNYYLYEPGPQRAFVREELQIIRPDTVTHF